MKPVLTISALFYFSVYRPVTPTIRHVPIPVATTGRPLRHGHQYRHLTSLPPSVAALAQHRGTRTGGGSAPAQSLGNAAAGLETGVAATFMSIAAMVLRTTACW